MILVELNEINFDVVRKYIDSGAKLEGFSSLFDEGFRTTTSELKYEELEPWIQWPSIHTGKAYCDHKVFRLGDMTKSTVPQIFELLEQFGYSVGAVSPMNAVNRLKAPAYFIPDPWTETPSAGGRVNKWVAEAISQTVNDNSQSKITVKSMVSLIIAFFRFVPASRFWFFVKYALSSRGKQWRKALFLDLLIHQIHVSLFRSKTPDFSAVFLNAGAHIQHHYFLSSSQISVDQSKRNPTWYVQEEADPVLEMLQVYDYILRDLQAMNAEILIATGLSQEPFMQSQFYYRLKNHEEFLGRLGINYIKVQPRMTRDFLIQFDSEQGAVDASALLSGIKATDGEPIFGEVDRRGSELFVVLTYDKEIHDEMWLESPAGEINLSAETVFVAIKNGGHVAKGYAHFSEGLREFAPESSAHVASLFGVIARYYGLTDISSRLVV